MTRTRDAVLALAAGVVVSYALRAKLVKLLTKTTGTWVGAPND